MRGEGGRIACEARSQLYEFAGARGFGFDVHGRLDHALDARDVDDVEGKSTLTQGIDALAALTLAQTQQAVRLSHLGPWQRSAEQLLSVPPNVLAHATGSRLHVIDAAKRVRSLV